MATYASLKYDFGTQITGSIPTAAIADDAITLAKMAGGTDGNIITYDASGNPAVVATGSDGQVLTSAGSGQPAAMEDAAGGGFDVSSITGATALAAEPASTDEFVLSDAGTLKRLDMTHMMGLPACLVGGGVSLYPAHNTSTIVTWTVEDYDIGGCFNNTTGTVTLNGLTAPAHSFTPNVAGVYQIICSIYWAGEGCDGDSYMSIIPRFNGTDYTELHIGAMEHGHFDDNNVMSPSLIINVPFNGTGDYFQTKIWNTTGEAPELNYGYSSLSIHRIVGLSGETTRPDFG